VLNQSDMERLLAAVDRSTPVGRRDYAILRVFSRSWLGLWKTLQLKVLFYNLCHAGVISE
jgi:hypothetical protein